MAEQIFLKGYIDNIAKMCLHITILVQSTGTLHNELRALRLLMYTYLYIWIC